MRRLLTATLGLCAVLVLASLAKAGGNDAAPLSQADRDALALAEKIDELIALRWKSKGITPAAQADDAEFLRRVSLDIIGRIPGITDVSDFLGNRSPQKRWELVKLLLQSDRSSEHFAAVWRAIMFAHVNNQQIGFFNPGFEQYLRARFMERIGYDKIAREIVTAQPNAGNGPALFYQANENKLENLAAATSRLFLGVKIECAQCHNHPFAKWSRSQFWEYAAFFSGTPTGQHMGKPAALAIPGTEKKVDARFLDGTEPEWKKDVDRRAQLADWLTSPRNPWFARATANRVWEYFFGLGLVEPVDDFTEDNEPSHPELLDELARQLASHDFDLTFLVRAIVMSKTYQLTSAVSHPSQDDARSFARMAVRGMSAEQLFDSLAVATNFHDHGASYDPRLGRPFNPGGSRADFLARFPNQDRRTETQTSILQALYFMNGKLTVDATTLKSNDNLRAIAEARNVSQEKRIQELYMISLSRKPRPEETERLLKYLESGGPAQDQKTALADIFWALLNSTEFFFNH
jgi:hypothetical protein